MPPDRLRSIVPMFGGATNYVETLDAILEYIATNTPTTDELIGWHRGTFQRVQSRDSIMRRVQYLRQVGFLEEADDRWRLGAVGQTYYDADDTETLLQIMCERNVGLRSLLYALAAGPMSIEAISDQQLDTHPELGWQRGETDMALQRVNWLRSMGLLEPQAERYALTAEGHRFVEQAIAEWADSEWARAAPAEDLSAGTYDTTVQARSLDPEFRATVLARHDHTCPVSGVDHPGLLDVAHVLSWAEYPDYRASVTNTVPLSKTHHAAFDREVFTVDRTYCLRVNPAFETESTLLQRTIVDRAGEQMATLEGRIDPEYIEEHNAGLAWV